MPDQVYGVSLNGVEKQSYSFDNLGRLLTKTVNVSAGKNITYSYEYKDVGDNGTTTVVETFVNDFGTYVYEYDKNGNITKETFTPKNNKDTEKQEEQEKQEEAKITVYEYDKLGQLKLVTINGSDRYAYYYDASGNISNISYVDEAGGEHYPWYKYENANWRDQLTSFNGEAITYDEIGNPLSYRGATLTWQNGRQLAKYQKGSMIAEYKYDGNGNRISKTHNGNTYEFIYNGSNLVAMTNTGTTLFNWICDENGDYLGFTYCGVEYYYIRNLQNDVIGIKNPSGTVVVEYEYDPFGKVIATTGPLADTLGKLNPIRYRGYFYDTETGFYFLQSRYYDPDTCRFINADGAIADVGGDVLGYNLFAYCFNNPINMEDPNGNWAVLKELANRVKYAVTTTFRIFTLPLTALEVKVGVGVGIGGEFSAKVKGINMSASAKKSCTDSLEIKNRKVDLKSTTSEEVGFSVGSFSVGNSCGKEHSLFDKDCTCSFLDTPIVQRANCPANIDFTEESYIIGMSAGLYLGIGVEASIGINLETLFTEMEDICNTEYISIY